MRLSENYCPIFTVQRYDKKWSDARNSKKLLIRIIRWIKRNLPSRTTSPLPLFFDDLSPVPLLLKERGFLRIAVAETVFESVLGEFCQCFKRGLAELIYFERDFHLVEVRGLEFLVLIGLDRDEGGYAGLVLGFDLVVDLAGAPSGDGHGLIERLAIADHHFEIDGRDAGVDLIDLFGGFHGEFLGWLIIGSLLKFVERAIERAKRRDGFLQNNLREPSRFFRKLQKEFRTGDNQIIKNTIKP